MRCCRVSRASTERAWWQCVRVSAWFVACATAPILDSVRPAFRAIAIRNRAFCRSRLSLGTRSRLSSLGNSTQAATGLALPREPQKQTRKSQQSMLRQSHQPSPRRSQHQQPRQQRRARDRHPAAWRESGAPRVGGSAVPAAARRTGRRARWARWGTTVCPHARVHAEHRSVSLSRAAKRRNRSTSQQKAFSHRMKVQRDSCYSTWHSMQMAAYFG